MALNKFKVTGDVFTNLTDSSTGTASGTLATASGLSTSNTYTDAAVNAKLDIVDNSVASLAAKIKDLQDQLNDAN